MGKFFIISIITLILMLGVSFLWEPDPEQMEGNAEITKKEMTAYRLISLSAFVLALSSMFLGDKWAIFFPATLFAFITSTYSDFQWRLADRRVLRIGIISNTIIATMLFPMAFSAILVGMVLCSLLFLSTKIGPSDVRAIVFVLPIWLSGMFSQANILVGLFVILIATMIFGTIYVKVSQDKHKGLPVVPIMLFAPIITMLIEFTAPYIY